MKIRYYLLIAITALLVNCTSEKPTESVPGISVPEGFVVEKIYEPSKFERGSWVSLAVDHKGRLYGSDQYGSIYRIDNPKKNTLEDADIQKIDLEIGGAHGLLWHNNSLLVVVNAWRGKPESLKGGLYQLKDTDNDDILDERTLIQEINGGGEHGPHSIILGPDNLYYLIAGNHTDIPENFNSLVPDIWAEDNVLPNIKDPRGHANNKKEPAGWIARVDQDFKNWEVYAVGFRNPFDMAFNENDELFAFDSDMEWDMGSPWYRPIRVCHVIEGSEYGWRTGSGKFAPYYHDNLNSVVDVGQGSPTGVIYGGELNFPTRYKSGIFIMDWSFGTMYFVDLKAEGSTYKAGLEEFISGKPLPLTDMISIDGNMYFATGGRRLESALFRVTYVGDEESNPAQKNVNSAAKERIMISGLSAETSDESLEVIWDNLGNADRFIAFTARTSLEKREGHEWYERIKTEENTKIALNAITATARLGFPVNVEDLYNKLASIDFATLDEEHSLMYLRTVELVMSRLGNVPLAKKNLGDMLLSQYPSESNDQNRELSKILSVMNVVESIPKTMELLQASESADVDKEFLNKDVIERSSQYGDIIDIIRRNNPETRKLGYLEALSVVEDGWTEDQRKTYFATFSEVFTSGGGESYKGFAEKIFERALSNVPATKQNYFKDISGYELKNASRNDLADLPKPVGPPRAWDTKDLLALEKSLSEGDAANGKEMYKAALCASCHAKDGLGKIVGPELSTLGNRFSYADIITAIQNPSKTISSQFAATNLELTDDRTIRGRILSEENDTIIVSVNAFDANAKMKVPVNMVKNRELSPVSDMPPGMLNRLNEKEVKDLMKYLLESE